MQTSIDTPQSTAAWLLAIRGHGHVALGEHEMIHLIAHNVDLFPVPRSPAHCRCVILWENQVLPVLDLATLVGGGRYGTSDRSLAGTSRLMAVLAFSARPGAEATRVAVLLDAVPERCMVAETAACDRAEELGAWAAWSVSGFRHQKYGAVPILNLPKLFASPLMDIH